MRKGRPFVRQIARLSKPYHEQRRHDDDNPDDEQDRPPDQERATDAS
jgi:hypothetical protein